MKAVVLAGGHATRLWPVTRNRAKPLLPLDGVPIIDYIMSELAATDAIDEIYISTNKRFAPDFESYVQRYGYEDTEIVVEDQRSEDEKPGTIGAILKLLDEHGMDDDYLIIGGDNYYSFAIQDFLEFTNGMPAVACYDIGDTSAASSFGVVTADEEHTITDFTEKPEDPDSTLVSMACYYFPEDKLELFEQYADHFATTVIPEEQYLDEPGRLIEWAHTREQMRAFSFSGDWFDIGTRQGYLDAHAAVAEESTTVNGAVTDTELGENVWVMDGADVTDSHLENCIIFPEAEIEDTTVKDSIIDREATLSGADLESSIIGEYSRIKTRRD
ncbi:MAG: NDP-sugar synthase [Candidatus Nanohaloarchaeota archaeon QJJ-5]|nr:NDP-sugar synthase [Candidatus Nanohaloarchaeota archaeon QJJ-5]